MIVVVFFGVGAGFAIHHKITKPGVPLLVPLAQVDLITNAVWAPGGGQLAKEEEQRLKEVEKLQGTAAKWYSWRRIKSIF